MCGCSKKKMVGYRVVHSLDRNVMAMDVLTLRRQGWTLAGFSTCSETQGTAFTQALVMYEGDDVEDNLFDNTEPPPKDKETRLFADPVYAEAETQAALNVPCMFCGEFPEARALGSVYCEDTCWGRVCPNFAPQQWIEKNGEEGWRVRELRKKQGDKLGNPVELKKGK